MPGVLTFKKKLEGARHFESRGGETEHPADANLLSRPTISGVGRKSEVKSFVRRDLLFFSR